MGTSQDIIGNTLQEHSRHTIYYLQEHIALVSQSWRIYQLKHKLEYSAQRLKKPVAIVMLCDKWGKFINEVFECHIRS